MMCKILGVLLLPLLFAQGVFSQQARPTIEKQFASTQVAVSAFTQLTFTISNPSATSYTNLGFLDDLPAGLSIFPGAISNNQCGGTLMAAPGATSISLTGGTIAPTSVCQVVVFVQGDTVGPKFNIVRGSGDLIGSDATATTTVIAPTLTKSFSPAVLTVGGTTTLTFTLTNDTVPAAIFGAVSGFVDNLPVGMTVVAIGLSTCQGSVTSPNPSQIVFTQAGADSLPTGSCTITATVKVLVAGVIVNTATGNRALSGQLPSATVLVNPPADSYQVRYASNLTSGDSVINLTNTGVNGAALNGPGFGAAAGNLCINAYTFSPDEQLVSCCSCLITPNGLASMSVGVDLLNNTLTGVRPNSVIVKLVSTAAGPDYTGNSCNNSAALAGTVSFPLAAGLVSFGTTVHASTVVGNFTTTETPFLKATLSVTELASITNRCTNIIGNGSGFGICNACRTGGSAGLRQ